MNGKTLIFPHFPDRLSAVIFRNWNMVPLERMAETLSAPPDELKRIAGHLGLPASREKHTSAWLERGYITLIRQNWHLLPLEQISSLLGMSPKNLDFILKEEDFLFYKLGNSKPEIPPLIYRTPDEHTLAQYREIGRIVRDFFPEPDPLAFDSFHFPECAGLPLPDSDGLRISYLYDLPYGDPLADDSLSAFPESKLRAYARAGINGLWFQALLYKMFPPGGSSPESERIVGNLQRLCRRAARFGLKFYLYFNEPRMAEPEVFAALTGRRHDSEISSRYDWLCTSDPAVRHYLFEAFRSLFSAVPELGGVIMITRSENKTHCCSHKDGRHESCPLCSGRSVPEVVAELLNTVYAGMTAGLPGARLLAWTWAWDEPEKTIAALADGITVLQTSEKGVVTDCFGVPGKIDDYSVGWPGPSDFAVQNWRAAQKAGHHDCAAKIQINNSWECSAVPYIPVFGLVERHIANLRRSGVSDFMISWTLGGAPSPMAALLVLPREEVVRRLYGDTAAAVVLEADDCFCEGLHHFPRNGTSCIYCGPTNYGPMNLLWEKPTGRLPTMLGFPYDALVNWRSPFPEDVFARAFREMCISWKKGLEILDRLDEGKIPASYRGNFLELKRFAMAVYTHFKSSCNQITFIISRDRGVFDRNAVEDEIVQAMTLFRLQKADPRIGFEASNHYFYTPNALMEKVLSCRLMLLKRQVFTAAWRN